LWHHIRKNKKNKAYPVSDVKRALCQYKERHFFVYRRPTPPPPGWESLRAIAEKTGGKRARLSRACQALSLVGHIWKGKVYTRTTDAVEWLKWRRPGFVLRHRSPEWLKARRAWQKKEGLTPPPSLKNPLFGAVFAPELINL
jgi:hypothetical protein